MSNYYLNSNASAQAPSISNSSSLNELTILPRELKEPLVSFDLLAEDDLSPLQKERYDYLTMYYGESMSLTILSAMTTHGLNDWKTVGAKITAISEHQEKPSQYATDIDQSIRLNMYYSTSDIIKLVSAVRRQLNMKPHLRNIQKNCIKDFLASYMAIGLYKGTDNEDAKVLIGYTPVVNLNSQL